MNAKSNHYTFRILISLSQFFSVGHPSAVQLMGRWMSMDAPWWAML